MIPALLFETAGQGRVGCRLCAHRCLLAAGQTGICGVRRNSGGTLFSLNADRIAAVHVDPIEKKPLYHFLPASRSYSIAAMGCNFRCDFCQNHTLSQVSGTRPIEGIAMSAEALVEEALAGGCRSISYTYSEPTVFFELMLEVATLARVRGLKNVMVTNGFMTPDALNMIAPFLDAANVDLKSFTDDFYVKYCRARLEPVLATIREMKKRGVWTEVTTLLIPGINDDPRGIGGIIDFIAGLDPAMPWHVSRFFPQFRMTEIDCTPADLIIRVLRQARRRGLLFPYGGNIEGGEAGDTLCPACHKELISRHGYQVRISGLESGRCRFCQAAVPGVWEM